MISNNINDNNKIVDSEFCSNVEYFQEQVS